MTDMFLLLTKTFGSKPTSKIGGGVNYNKLKNKAKNADLDSDDEFGSSMRKETKLDLR